VRADPLLAVVTQRVEDDLVLACPPMPYSYRPVVPVPNECFVECPLIPADPKLVYQDRTTKPMVPFGSA
jgi:hypothetical protein